MMDASRETGFQTQQVNSERLQEYEQGLVKFKRDGVQHGDRERDQNSIYQEPITVAMGLQRKN